MATLNALSVGITGLVNPVYAAAAAGGDDVAPGDTRFVHVKNGAAASVTVTVVVPGTEYGQQKPDVPVAIPAGGSAFIGPLTHDLAGVNGRVALTYSASASVTLLPLDI